MTQTNLQTEMSNGDTLEGKYLIFTIGSELYGIEIRNITEIVSVQRITEIPDMPDYVKGIVNLRGKIIPVMDARLRFKKEAREYDDKTCMIVINNDRASIGLVVDGVVEVCTIPNEDIVPSPELGKGEQNYIMGIGKSNGNISLLLDCQRLLQDDELVLSEEHHTAVLNDYGESSIKG